MNLIVAVDKNWGIGKNNKLLTSIPADMKFFVSKTTGNVVVMGRKTLESFPNKKPLKNRVNIVLTRNPDYQVEGAIVVRSDEELQAELAKYDSEKIFVIGGESIYKKMLNMCDVAYVTKMDYAYDADAHFPNLDEMDNWELAEAGEEETYFDLEYAFCTYRRVK
ncbi:MAG: dihydrofolate reductase [Lachnospiraceae bacterium]|jgi:dihydrofolate reductase|nr:dihydrofolate reductase [Lachnospiraceae bacterium]MBQ4301092.1 dihydrofolate reductase [Lachnospiraceae bacterium]